METNFYKIQLPSIPVWYDGYKVMDVAIFPCFTVTLYKVVLSLLLQSERDNICLKMFAPLTTFSFNKHLSSDRFPYVGKSETG